MPSVDVILFSDRMTAANTLKISEVLGRSVWISLYDVRHVSSMPATPFVSFANRLWLIWGSFVRKEISNKNVSHSVSFLVYFLLSKYLLPVLCCIVCSLVYLVDVLVTPGFLCWLSHLPLICNHSLCIYFPTFSLHLLSSLTLFPLQSVGFSFVLFFYDLLIKPQRPSLVIRGFILEQAMMLS